VLLKASWNRFFYLLSWTLHRNVIFLKMNSFM
jgi:hypothetical protein